MFPLLANWKTGTVTHLPDNPEESDSLRLIEMLSHVEEGTHTYFGLFTLNQLSSVVNMCPEFKTEDSVTFENGTWLQSVT